MLLTTRYHLTSRPVSFANDTFFTKLATYCDKLLSLLREPGWPQLESSTEVGISTLRPVLGAPATSRSKKDLHESFGLAYRRYFRGINVPWSRLAPVDSLTIKDWPIPAHIYLAVGPNIGIGDEMTFFPVAQLLSETFPEAFLEVSSFRCALWDRCSFVSSVVYRDEDLLAPYARAIEVLRNAPDSLIIFVEFASAPMYRHLENVPGLKRFTYLDTGSRLARVVDQSRQIIAEYKFDTTSSIYELIMNLSEAIGLPWTLDQPGDQGVRGLRMVPVQGRAKRVFVNPFSSKDPNALGPKWWTELLNSVSETDPIDVLIFTGINRECDAFAHEIAGGLNMSRCNVSFFGGERVPSILETIETAIASDLILGLDTFTGHTGRLRRTPTISVFFGSFWEAWRVPDCCVLNATIYDLPDSVAKLAKRLLWVPHLGNSKAIRDVVLNSRRLQDLLGEESVTVSALVGQFDRCRTAVRQWITEDPDLLTTFTDVPLAYAEWLQDAVIGRPESCHNLQALKRLLTEAMRIWRDSNLHRYARYVLDVSQTL